MIEVPGFVIYCHCLVIGANRQLHVAALLVMPGLQSAVSEALVEGMGALGTFA
jgi:hypothetical protein